MKKVPVGLQLWSIREETKRDFSAAVAAVAQMGYEGVELAGYGSTDAKGAKAALDAAGLKVAGMHVSYASLSTEPNAVISDALLLGAHDVTCAWWPPAHFVSRQACERIGEQLDRVGETLRSFGLRFGFHNHEIEFSLLEGRPALEWMIGASQPRNVCVELDVYWAHAAGYPPERFIRDHGARVALLHLRDSKELGTGPIDFTAVFAAADPVGAVDWYIVEQEAFSHAPLESVRLCLEQLRAWGRA